jgi:small subunit ribosomal protein S1
LGLKQLQPDPWALAAQQFKTGDRVKGSVVRLADFGAFVELAPGIDGLIHLSEMSWTRRVKKPSDILQVGEQVEAIVLEVKPSDKRISLGLKQALGNPWDDIEKNFPVDSIVEGPVKSLAQFGAFIELGEGIDGMIHVGDISREKRLNHPNEVLKLGQVVRAQVLEIDKGKKRIRLGMKQLEPTSADLFIGEHKVGDSVSGRVVEVRKDDAKIELAEGVHARCRFARPAPASEAAKPAAADIDDLAALLNQKWRMGAGGGEGGGPPVKTGQIRRFTITLLDAASKRIDVELAD